MENNHSKFEGGALTARIRRAKSRIHHLVDDLAAAGRENPGGANIPTIAVKMAFAEGLPESPYEGSEGTTAQDKAVTKAYSLGRDDIAEALPALWEGLDAVALSHSFGSTPLDTAAITAYAAIVVLWKEAAKPTTMGDIVPDTPAPVDRPSAEIEDAGLPEPGAHNMELASAPNSEL